VRWCPENKTNGDKGRNNIANATTLPRIEIIKICPKCKKEFKVLRTLQKNGDINPAHKEKIFCSCTCSNSHTFSPELKQRLRLNRKKLKIGKVCPSCGIVFYSRHSTCSRVCGLKERYKNLDKDSLIYYRQQCRFNFALSNYPDKFDFDLINEHGWYKAKNHGDNLYGVSRDHMVSVRYGFDNKIPPEIISHPANCQLLLHSDNISKLNKCSISIEELYQKIKAWDEKFPIDNTPEVE
jgi:hypothetical protein